jgi:DNA-binding MarR family transcriptional regulator
LAVTTWLRLARVFQHMDRATTDRLRCMGLSAAQFDLLAQVGNAEGRTQAELAKALLVTKGNITQLLDRMECAGLIVRRPEGRANRLYLTAAGRALYDRTVPCVEALIAERFGALSPEEQAHLLALLRRIDRAFD